MLLLAGQRSGVDRRPVAAMRRAMITAKQAVSVHAPGDRRRE
ncbi:hypothetical protein [uncultured Sphingomonas sp.]|nr:hypothetical protein [uncultured Sphingomonas sp.]